MASIVFNSVFLMLLLLLAAASAQEATTNNETMTTTTTTTTTTPAPDNSNSSKPEMSGSDSPPPVSESAAGPGDNGSDDAKQPKVFIIHHHYRDPSDFEFARRLQPVNGAGAGGLPINFGPGGFEPRSSELNQAPPGYGGDQLPSNQPEEQPEDNQRFDPLGQFSDTQKKRQFYQDLLTTHLSKFESEIEPMIEREENVTQKNDMEEVLGAVQDLKRMLEHHQIFNISELMNDWKEGKFMPVSSPSSPPPVAQAPPSTEPQVRHHFHYRSSPSQPTLTIYRAPPVTQTYVLVPQRRMIQPEFAPHFNPHQNTFSVPNSIRGQTVTSSPMFFNNHRFPSSPSSSFPSQQPFSPFNQPSQPQQYFQRFPNYPGPMFTGRSASGDEPSPPPVNDQATAPATSTAVNGRQPNEEIAYQ